MNRVEEIAAAMQTHPEPMFLYGLVASARHDYDGVLSDLVTADRLVWAEKQAREKED
jgi:hypothetical protein